MKRSILTFGTAGLFCLSLLLSTFASAQTFENTFGSLANHDTPQDGKPIPNGRYIVLSNTLSYSNASRILLTRLAANGSVNMHATIHDINSPNTHYYGTAIELDRDAAGTHTGYFIAGSRSTPNGRQAILIRTNTSGTPTWVKLMPNTDAGGALVENGVSVERQSNGDVILTVSGYSPSANNYRFTVARFNSGGGQLWSNRYYGTDSGQSFEATEACNAVRSGAATIVVTGRSWTSGSPDHHTFLSCIDAATGAELWRRNYNSNMTRDAGIDVVYKPANGAAEPAALMVVGAAGLQASVMWVIRANPLNGIASTKFYSPNIAFISFRGLAVNLDVNGTRAVVAGDIISQPVPGGNNLNGTFAMLLPFYGTELPDWTYYFSSTSPQIDSPRSISPVSGASAGYFLTCGTNLTGSAFHDAHAVRMDQLGGIGAGACPTQPLTVARTVQGVSGWRSFNRTPQGWTNIVLTRTAQSFAQETCTPELGEAGEERSEAPSFGDADALLYPNPVGNGRDAVLQVNLPEAAGVQIQAFDLAGRLVWSQQSAPAAGETQISLPAAQWAPGVYVISLRTEAINRSWKLVVGE
ncbi:MAG: T9SS type A sorting domain-containing protein [Saprospiraceae bacterium]|nr:T9SS type A sorting domain-containing protein [Saprospiraceae bacterium]